MFLRLIAVVRLQAIPRFHAQVPAAVAYPSPFPLQVCVYGPGDAAGLSAWGRSRDDRGREAKGPLSRNHLLLTSPVAAWAGRNDGVARVARRVPGPGIPAFPAPGPLPPFQRIGTPFTFSEGRQVFQDTGFAVP